MLTLCLKCLKDSIHLGEYTYMYLTFFTRQGTCLSGGCKRKANLPFLELFCRIRQVYVRNGFTIDLSCVKI